MNDKNIFDALRDIDEQWILDAAPQKRKSVASTWVKWGALAACLCLVVASFFGVVYWLQSGWGALPFHTHVFGEWEVTREASCSERGEQTRVCACGERETELIALLPHFAGEWVIEKEPTIKMPTPDDPTQRESGLKCRFCDRCGAKIGEEVIPATGSLGLAYAINPDGKTFAVAGIGNCTDADIVVPENFCGYHVTSVMESAFRGCSGVQSITLPETVTVIGNYAFESSFFQKVILPTGLLEIGEYAFAGSTLTQITIPSNAKIGNRAFMQCGALRKVVLEEGVKEITDYAFEGSYLLTTVVLPKGLERIGKSAFSGCSQLEAITLPSTVTQIGAQAFSRCSSLKKIALPAGLKTVEESLFSYCYRLENVVIPFGVEKIQCYAFESCYRLSSIVIPSSVTKIAWGVFQNCSALERVVLPEGLEAIARDTFSGCDVLRELEIPDSVKSIGENAFDFCEMLIEIENDICYVGKWAVDYDRYASDIVVRDGTVGIADKLFYEYGRVVRVTLPNSIKYIGARSFADNSNLKGIVFKGTAEEWEAVQKGEYWDQYSNWYSILFQPEEEDPS